MSATIEAPRGVAVINARRPIAICEDCGSAHDPYETGEWGVCADCFGEAVARSIAAHPAGGGR